MAKRLKTAPRRRPQQSRAQDTVDAILTGAAKLLVSSGYDTMSTNRIALAAGVSIGSLYQYFPSKEAIIAALVEQHCHQMSKISQAALAAHATSSIEVTARAVVEAMVAAQSVNPKLHQAIREQVPRVGKLNFVDAMHLETAGVVAMYLTARKADLNLPDPELAAFFAVKTVDALLQQMDSAVVTSRGKVRLIDEIVSLLVAYLKRRR